MWIKPSGYVACAVLAGALAASSLAAVTGSAAWLVVLWVVIDLCATSLARSVRALRRPSTPGAAVPGRRVRVALGGAIALGTGVILASLLPREVAYVAAGAALVTLVGALALHRQPTKLAEAFWSGVLLLGAWVAACLLMRAQLYPTAIPGALFAFGTYARLRHATQPRRWSLWLVRISWAGLLATLVIARQPLVAGIVALTACGDDLLRRAPANQGDAGRLGAAAWAITALLVAVAGSYWAAGV